MPTFSSMLPFLAPPLVAPPPLAAVPPLLAHPLSATLPLLASPLAAGAAMAFMAYFSCGLCCAANVLRLSAKDTETSLEEKILIFGTNNYFRIFTSHYALARPLAARR